MNPRNIFIPVLLLLVVACADKTQKKILDFGVFKLTVPAGWTKFKKQGIDTYVGGLTNGTDTLHFGYGHYYEEVGQFTDEKMKYAADTVNGLRANIGLSETPGHLAVMIISVNREDQFIINGSDLKQPVVALDIFRSVVFEESNVSKNHITSVDSFISRAPVTGKGLFRMYCVSCHSLAIKLVGPALSERVNVRNDQWMYAFLKNRASVSADTGQIRLKKQYGFECPDFSNLTDEERWALIDYIKVR
ncbi:c-type cytochrome [Chitinophaga pinensis]|uniref:Cytochrome c n=1 Tax=Chitinophaga pinensis TaxID=79329 RepID=A0A5C6LKI1_9BACT|nr:cytochrome c [Chitinophaga pinensis]TWV92757.1 cytochrome c [Chitinophaga pinensis]